MRPAALPRSRISETRATTKGSAELNFRIHFPPDPFIYPQLRGSHLARNRKFVDSPLEGTGFELPVRGRGQSVCRPSYAAECSGQVGAASQFSDSTTPCIKAAWTRPPRQQSVPATHSAEFCLVREKTATLYRV